MSLIYQRAHVAEGLVAVVVAVMRVQDVRGGLLTLTPVTTPQTSTITPFSGPKDAHTPPPTPAPHVPYHLPQYI